jgi:hypothetical protein
MVSFTDYWQFCMKIHTQTMSTRRKIMKKKMLLAGTPGILLVFGLILIGCSNGTTDNGGGNGGGGSNPFIGTWETIVGGQDISYTFSASSLTIRNNGSTTGSYSYTYDSSTITLSNGAKWTYWFDGSALYLDGTKYLK